MALIPSRSYFYIIMFCMNIVVSNAYANVSEIEAKIEEATSIKHVKLNEKYDVNSCDVLIEVLPSKIKLQCKDESFIFVPYMEAKIIPVLNSSIVKGDVIDESMLELKKIEISKINSNTIIARESVIGGIAKRKLEPGKVIHKQDIQKEYAISKGQHVTIMYKKTGFSIEAHGIALENAAIGDTIKIKNLDSGKMLFGKVSDSETVIMN